MKKITSKVGLLMALLAAMLGMSAVTASPASASGHCLVDGGHVYHGGNSVIGTIQASCWPSAWKIQEYGYVQQDISHWYDWSSNWVQAGAGR